MTRVKKLVGMVMFFMMLGSTAIFAQTPQLMQEQQQTEVTDAELTKFIAALQGIQTVTQQAQQEMMQIVEKKEMDIARFNEIHEGTVNSEVELQATPEEIGTYKEIITQLETMQASIQSQMEKLITDQGISLQRYEQIAMQLQSDPALQQRIQQMIQG